MSKIEAMRHREHKLSQFQVTIPTVFESRLEYGKTLRELIDKEAEIEKLNNEVITEKFIEFKIEKITNIYCRLRMRVPKIIQEYIRENVILSVVIPIKVSKPRTIPEYVGTGTIKKVEFKARDSHLTVIFQLDIFDPLNKKNR